VATRVNGAWGADGAYLLDGNPPINWNEEPGSGLEAHQLCVEISQSVQAQIRGYEREHLRDLARAWILTVGMLVEALPTSGYANTGDALDHRDQQRRIILTPSCALLGPSPQFSRSAACLTDRTIRTPLHLTKPQSAPEARLKESAVTTTRSA
jgi:hypothetical protein